MGARFGDLLLEGVARRRYERKIRATGPLAYWPMGEASNGVAYDRSGNGYNGAYLGVTLGEVGIGDGRTCPFFDGVNDACGVYSAGLAGAFDGNLGSALLWTKVTGAGVYADGASRRLLHLTVDAANRVVVTKLAASGDIYLGWAGTGLAEKFVSYDEASVGWVCYAMTWSKAGNEMKGFRAGAQIGSTQAIGAGTFTGALPANGATIGGGHPTTPTLVWDGFLAHVALWSRVLAPAEVARLSRV